MNGWELFLRHDSPPQVDAAEMSLLENVVDPRCVADIQLPTSRPGKAVSLAQLFDIRQRSDNKIVISGDVSFLHRLGLGWMSCSLVVNGNVGSGLGTSMRGGTIEVLGNTADLAACQLRGGLIRIMGNTGNYLGGPLAGRRSGMSGGRVVVMGRAGHHAGHRMRRGTIIISDDCGAGVASDMVAGTIAVGGRAGDFVGAGMKRGTVILTHNEPLDAIRFTTPRRIELPFMRLLANDLRSDAPAISMGLNGAVDRCRGDRSVGGQGEIIIVRK